MTESIDERLPESITADALLTLGRAYRKQGKMDEAIEYFARAVEKQMENEEEEVSGDLADFLIAYADTLLIKEESNAADFLGGGGGDDESDGDEGTIPRLDSGRVDQPAEAVEEDLSDIQLAWESFEHARLCLLCRPESPERARDLSFVHCRLADIQAIQEQFADSIADYGESIEQALQANEPARKVAGIIVSLSQTVQTIMSSAEAVNSSQVDVGELVRKFQAVFSTVKSKFGQSSQTTSEPSLAHLAKDGFLLAQCLLTSAGTSSAELLAQAEDCVAQESEMKQAHGVASHGFAPSSTSSTNVVTVTVKRKADADVQASKKSKDNIERADKAKIVD
jgi:tetratricopeptide (TPR) repeat protein